MLLGPDGREEGLLAALEEIDPPHPPEHQLDIAAATPTLAGPPPPFPRLAASLPAVLDQDVGRISATEMEEAMVQAMVTWKKARIEHLQQQQQHLQRQMNDVLDELQKLQKQK